MNLFYYIGISGVAALSLMLCGMLLLAIFFRNRKRTLIAFRVLLMVIAALWLTERMWRDVSNIRPDRTEEMKLGRERQRQERLREVRTAEDRARQIRFAEETPDDRDVELAREKEPEKLSRYEQAAREPEITRLDDSARAYRERGVQRRERTAKSDEPDDGLFRGIDREMETEELVILGRVMAEADMYMALRWGRFLIGFSQLALWISLLYLGFDYVSRFNRTTDFFFPLPLGLVFLDRCLPKKMRTWIGQAESRQIVDLLHGIIRRGESLIYFGDAVSDVMVHDLSRKIAAVADGKEQGAVFDAQSTCTVRRLFAGPIRLLPMDIAPAGESWHPYDDTEYVFETAWFNRQSFVCKGYETGCRLMKDMLSLIEYRLHSHAFAFHTLHIIWQHDKLPDNDLMAEWIRIASQINIKLVFITPEDAVSSWKSQFDEQYSEWPERSPVPWVFDKLAEGKGGESLYAGIRRNGKVLAGEMRKLGPVLRDGRLWTVDGLKYAAAKAAPVLKNGGRWAAGKIRHAAGSIRPAIKNGRRWGSGKLQHAAQVYAERKADAQAARKKAKAEAKQKQAEAEAKRKQAETEAKRKQTEQGAMQKRKASAESQHPDTPEQIRSKEDLAARIRARREAEEDRRRAKEEQKHKIREKLGLAGKSPGTPPAPQKDSSEIEEKAEEAAEPAPKVESIPASTKPEPDSPDGTETAKSEPAPEGAKSDAVDKHEEAEHTKPEAEKGAVAEVESPRQTEAVVPPVEPEKKVPAFKRDAPAVKTAPGRTQVTPKKKIVLTKRSPAGIMRKQPVKARTETGSELVGKVEERPPVAPPARQSVEERPPVAPPVKQNEDVSPPVSTNLDDIQTERPPAAPTQAEVAATDSSLVEPEKATVSGEQAAEETSAPVTEQPVADNAASPAVETTNIEFNCPLCKLRMAISSEYAGQPVECPGCKGVINVPHESQPDTSQQKMLKFNCPHCGQVMEGQDDWTGLAVACPACNGSLVVPARDQIAASVFKFFCQHCGQKLSAQNEWIGQAIECPKCSNSITINPPGIVV